MARTMAGLLRERAESRGDELAIRFKKSLTDGGEGPEWESWTWGQYWLEARRAGARPDPAHQRLDRQPARRDPAARSARAPHGLHEHGAAQQEELDGGLVAPAPSRHGAHRRPALPLLQRLSGAHAVADRLSL